MFRRIASLTVALIGTLTAAAYALEKRIPYWLAENLPKADAVLIKKAERGLYLMRAGRPYKRYSVSLGGNPAGHKLREGDQRTPEGDYILDWRNPDSRFYKSIHLSYPNEQDKREAEARGVPPGGLIMIHGLRNGFGWLGPFAKLRDWTQGCIAVTNPEMEEIWRAVADGTPVRIEP